MIMSKRFLFFIILLTFTSLMFGQKDIILKYLPNQYENNCVLPLPPQCFEHDNYKMLSHYDTTFISSDTLFIILPDDRVFHTLKGGQKYYEICHILGISHTFSQKVPIQTKTRYVIVVFNGYSITFKKKHNKSNKYSQIDIIKDDKLNND